MRDAIELRESESRSVTILGLPCWMKALLVSLVLLPRILVAGILLWLGSRWLTATADLEDVLLNALSLEFILFLREPLYKVFVSNRNKHETINTYILPVSGQTPASTCFFIGTFWWGLAAVGWAFFYVSYGQVVLEDYKWDVATVCGRSLPLR